jgi:hypothetical protein
MLLMGNSGTGKTGALASLALAGFNLRILDFDAGCDILFDLLKSDQAALERVVFETVTDKLRTIGNNIVPDGRAEAFSTAMSLLDRWKVAAGTTGHGEIIPAYDLGPVASWGPNDILIIDSLTMLSNAAMRHTLCLNNRPAGPKQQSDWGQAMDYIENVLALLYSSHIKCNVIVNAHIGYVGEDAEARGYPNTLGQKLPPKVGRYFNTILMTRTLGTGPAAKRQILTMSEGIIDLKNPAPSAMPRTLPLETGLATFFDLVRGVDKAGAIKAPAKVPAKALAPAPAKTA